MRLLDSYSAALTGFHNSQEPFLNCLRSRDPEWRGDRTTKDRAYTKLILARREYWGHTELHGCRQAGGLVIHQTADGRYTCTMRISLRFVGSL
jgi:hypothetical protein